MKIARTFSSLVILMRVKLCSVSVKFRIRGTVTLNFGSGRSPAVKYDNINGFGALYLFLSTIFYCTHCKAFMLFMLHRYILQYVHCPRVIIYYVYWANYTKILSSKFKFTVILVLRNMPNSSYEEWGKYIYTGLRNWSNCISNTALLISNYFLNVLIQRYSVRVRYLTQQNIVMYSVECKLREKCRKSVVCL